MGLFGRKSVTVSEPPTQPRHGAGRSLRSLLSLSESVDALHRALDKWAPTKYEHMTPVFPLAVEWHGSGAVPTEAWGCSYPPDEEFVLAYWPSGGGSEIGFFPLGGSEESLHTPLI